MKIISTKIKLLLVLLCVLVSSQTFAQCTAGFSVWQNPQNSSISFQSTNTNSFPNSSYTSNTYYWDFGDGATATGSWSQHSYLLNGVYSVRHIYTVIDSITNAVLCIDTTTQSVNVTNAGCGGNSISISQTQNVVNFTRIGTNYSPAQASMVFNWDFGDGNTLLNQTSPFAQHTYIFNGNYTARLIVDVFQPNTTTLMCSDTVYQTVNVWGIPLSTTCIASYTASNTLPAGSVSFTNTSTSGTSAPTTTSYSWNFDDGSTSNLQSPTHLFTASGTFNVCLTTNVRDSATNSLICSDFICTPVVINSPSSTPCTAGFNAYQNSQNSVVVFYPSGTSSLPISTTTHTYDWDFGDGITAFTSTAIGSSTNHTYLFNGLYNIKLIHTVLDSPSNVVLCVDSITQSVTITNAGCSGSSISLNQNQNVANFTRLGTSINPAQATMVMNWDFGDGNTLLNQTSPTAQHTYTVNGWHSARLIVDLFQPNTTNIICSDTTYQSVNVTGVPLSTSCVASFIANTTSTNGAVSFNNTTTSGTTMATYVNSNWDFGDGSNSNSQNTSHLYASAGTYNVCLISSVYSSINNSLICIDTVCMPVVVTQVSSMPCEALFTITPDTVNTNNQLINYFNSAVSYPGTGGTITSYAWDFGDGNTSTLANPSHTYLTAGQYNVCLTITTSNNCTDNTCVLTNVQPQNQTQYTDLYGRVLPAPSVGAMVYLIEYNSVTQSLRAVRSAATHGSGNYIFFNVANGTYLLKAAYHNYDPAYNFYIPTYYNLDALWSGATNVVCLGPGSQNVYINMLQGTPTSGPGFIGGSVITGANKTLGVGDPKYKLSALLMDKSTGQFIAFSRTDINGEYTFDNVPMGDYQVFIEELGKTMTPADITITASNSSFAQVNFESNSTENHPLLAPSSNTDYEKNSLRYRLIQNPVQTDFAVKGLDGSQGIQLFDLNGKILKEFNAVQDGQSLNIQDISSGVYLIHIDGKYPVKPIKLVITR